MWKHEFLILLSDTLESCGSKCKRIKEPTVLLRVLATHLYASEHFMIECPDKTLGISHEKDLTRMLSVAMMILATRPLDL